MSVVPKIEFVRMRLLSDLSTIKPTKRSIVGACRRRGSPTPLPLASPSKASGNVTIETNRLPWQAPTMAKQASAVMLLMARAPASVLLRNASMTSVMTVGLHLETLLSYANYTYNWFNPLELLFHDKCYLNFHPVKGYKLGS